MANSTHRAARHHALGSRAGAAHLDAGRLGTVILVAATVGYGDIAAQRLFDLGRAGFCGSSFLGLLVRGHVRLLFRASGRQSWRGCGQA